MIGFIDRNKTKFGDEPICRQLPIAMSTYCEHKASELYPCRLAAGERRDFVLLAEIRRVFKASREPCGTR